MNETVTTTCNHAETMTPFCAICGKSTRPAREPGEIRRMRERMREAVKPDRTKSGGKPRDPMMEIMLMVLLDSALSWALGEMTDDQFLKLSEAQG